MADLGALGRISGRADCKLKKTLIPGAGLSGPIELNPSDFLIEVHVLKNEMGLQEPGWWSSSADKI